MTGSKTFLITGVSSGLGRAFAAGALAARPSCDRHGAPAGRRLTFSTAQASGHAVPLQLDVTDYDRVPDAVRRAEEIAGPVDVLVNNAGYGHEGVLEESSMDDLQRPVRRQRRSGRWR